MRAAIFACVNGIPVAQFSLPFSCCYVPFGDYRSYKASFYLSVCVVCEESIASVFAVFQLEEAQQEMSEQAQTEQLRSQYPHFTNLNEDIVLSGMITHFLKNDSTKVGRLGDDEPDDISLSGIRYSSTLTILWNLHSMKKF